MQFSQELITETRLSKTLAFILFITLPIISFLFGIKYGQNITLISNAPPQTNIISSVPIPTTTLTSSPISTITSSLVGPTLPVGWKIYQNSLCNYTIDYPQDWTVDENCGPGDDKKATCLKTKDFQGSIFVTTNIPYKGNSIVLWCENGFPNNVDNHDTLNSCLKAKESTLWAVQQDKKYLVCQLTNLGNFEMVHYENSTYRGAISQTSLMNINIEPLRSDYPDIINNILSSFVLNK